jgi:hypothetical protein
MVRCTVDNDEDTDMVDENNTKNRGDGAEQENLVEVLSLGRA